MSDYSETLAETWRTRAWAHRECLIEAIELLKECLLRMDQATYSGTVHEDVRKFLEKMYTRSREEIEHGR